MRADGTRHRGTPRGGPGMSGGPAAPCCPTQGSCGPGGAGALSCRRNHSVLSACCMPGGVCAPTTTRRALRTLVLNQGGIWAALWLRAEHFPGLCEAAGAQRGEAASHRLHSQLVAEPCSDPGCLPTGPWAWALSCPSDTPMGRCIVGAQEAGGPIALLTRGKLGLQRLPAPPPIS